MHGTGDHHIKQSKPGPEKQVGCFLSYIEDRKKR
jgi:hypothetical protein